MRNDKQTDRQTNRLTESIAIGLYSRHHSAAAMQSIMNAFFYY